MTQQVARFRELHRQQTPLILPNIWDAGAALLAQSLGARAVATTSAGVAWSMGYRDGYVLPFELQLELAKRIARVLEIPFSVDVENGYSDDPGIVAENIVMIASAGASGVNLEEGPDDPAVVISKINAARAALDRAGLDMFINLRCDVFLRKLVPADRIVAETIERGAAYKEAGADGLFVPALVKARDIEAVTSSLSIPLNIMSWPGVPKAEELAGLGVKRLSAGSNLSQVLWQTMADLSKDFLASGDSTPFMKASMPYAELQALFPHE
jgi:2-methylisocitrate lyase-like PEP mutase family enzyme